MIAAAAIIIVVMVVDATTRTTVSRIYNNGCHIISITTMIPWWSSNNSVAATTITANDEVAAAWSAMHDQQDPPFEEAGKHDAIVPFVGVLIGLRTSDLISFRGFRALNDWLRIMIRNYNTIAQSESMQRQEKFVIRLVQHILNETDAFVLIIGWFWEALTSQTIGMKK
jgi:hypothetical protein